MIRITLLLLALTSGIKTHAQILPKEQQQLDSIETKKDGVPFFFFDDFSDNRNSWPLFSTADHEMTITSGQLKITGISDQLNYRAWRILEKLDLNKDFSCSVSATWIEGAGNNGFGLEYCSNSSLESFNLFNISNSGYYEIIKFKSQWITLKPWTASSFINKGNAANVLRIEKTGNDIHYFINEHLVDKFPIDSEYGKMFGVRVLANQTVVFDNFELQGIAK